MVSEQSPVADRGEEEDEGEGILAEDLAEDVHVQRDEHGARGMCFQFSNAVHGL